MDEYEFYDLTTVVKIHTSKTIHFFKSTSTFISTLHS